jgi:L-ribulose-5-phosphate 3-epimerase
MSHFRESLLQPEKMSQDHWGGSMQRRDFLAATVALGTAPTLSLASLYAGSGRSNLGKLRNKKGVRTGMLPANISLLESFKVARDCGFDQIEPPATFDQQEAARIKEAAVAAPIEIGSVSNGMNWKYPLTAPDPSVAKKGFEAQTTALQNAHLWGAEAILMIPGVVTPLVTYREARDRSRKQIEQLLPLAEKLGVYIALEEVSDQGKFLLTPVEFAAYIDDFKSRWIKAYFDVGNVMPLGYPQDWIRTLGSRMVKVHLKDFDPKTRHYVNLGDGTVDWVAVRKAFADIGYSGTYTVELPSGDATYLRDVSRRIDHLLLSQT